MKFDKYYIDKKQVSYDGGITWADVYEEGEVVTRIGDLYASGLNSCDEFIEKYTFTVTLVSYEDNVAIYNVVSTKEGVHQDFEVLYDADWVDYEISGSNVIVTLEENYTLEDREVLITFKQSGSGLIEERTLEQVREDFYDFSAELVSSEDEEILYEVTSMFYSLSGDRFVPFTVENNADWIDVTIENYKVYFTLSPNYSTTSRTADIKFVQDESGLELTVTITQDTIYRWTTTEEVLCISNGQAKKIEFTYDDGSTSYARINDETYDMSRGGINREHIISAIIGEGIRDIRIVSCGSLTSITLPSSTEFVYCIWSDNIEEIFYEGTKEQWSNITKSGIPTSAIVHCIDGDVVTYKLLNTYSNGEVLEENSVNVSRKTSLISSEVSSAARSIDNYTFDGCTNLSSVTISDSVTSIGNWSFRGCTKLSSVTIPNNVESIGQEAFSGCSSLANAVIGNSVTSIGNSSFWYCTSLTSIEIPNSVTSIGSSAFRNCTSLTSVTIGSGVTSIGNNAFAWCNFTSIEIPNSVTSIGANVFYACDELESVTLGSGITSISDGLFSGCTKLSSITIPSGVTSIGDNAFNRCYGITNIEIPSGVTSIGNGAFQACTKLESVEIPSDVTNIAASAFTNCYNLTSVTLTDNITNIYARAFYGCSSLTSVNYNGTKTQWNAISKGTNWKYNVPTTCKVHCTDGDISI